MIKRFSDLENVIEIEIEDINGEVKKLKTNHISIEKAKNIAKTAKIDKNDTDSIFEAALEQMTQFFGGEKKDYKDYSAITLTQVIKYISGELYSKKLPKTEEKSSV